jgi:hypothetical protein
MHQLTTLQATQGVSERFDVLLDLFESFGYFLEQIRMRSDVPIKEGSKTVVVEILVELLKTLARATQMTKKNRLRGCFVCFCSTSSDKFQSTSLKSYSKAMR